VIGVGSRKKGHNIRFAQLSQCPALDSELCVDIYRDASSAAHPSRLGGCFVFVVNSIIDLISQRNQSSKRHLDKIEP
jgi:hypothetical protein